MVGKTRDIAKAEYELSGFELESRILEIRRDEMSQSEYAKKQLELDWKYNRCTEEQYYTSLAHLIEDPDLRRLAVLDVEKRFDKITDMEYEKQKATIKGEPWVTVIGMSFNGSSSLEGSFELDWNEHFVKKLESDGYVGTSPDHVVNSWFMEVCKNVAMEQFDGTGEFTADAEANLQAYKRWNNSKIDDSRRSYE